MSTVHPTEVVSSTKSPTLTFEFEYHYLVSAVFVKNCGNGVGGGLVLLLESRRSIPSVSIRVVCSICDDSIVGRTEPLC